MFFAFLTYLSLYILFGPYIELSDGLKFTSIIISLLAFGSIFGVYSDSEDHFLIGLFKLFFLGLPSFLFHYMIPVISFILFMSWYFFGYMEYYSCYGFLELECGMVSNQTGIYWKGILILVLTFYLLVQRIKMMGNNE